MVLQAAVIPPKTPGRVNKSNLQCPLYSPSQRYLQDRQKLATDAIRICIDVTYAIYNTSRKCETKLEMFHYVETYMSC